MTMKTILHKEHERGKGEYGWLSTRYSFSFADWYDETKMGFGTLRVLNDDTIAPGNGFGTHGHRDMEIITIVTKGAVRHVDSMGNVGVVKEGEVQVMSAGTGVRHSEHNDSDTEPLELFQLWIEPKDRNGVPRYDQRSFDFLSHESSLVQLVGGEALSINQDAAIYYGTLKEGKAMTYTLHGNNHGVYLFIIEGEISVGEIVLTRRDALAITETDTLDLTSKRDTTFLIVEVGV